jgi:hypothetical protein
MVRGKARSDPKPPTALPKWRRLAAAFCCLYLALQVIVPAIALGKARPQRFAWQMYSFLRPQARFVVVFPDRGPERIEPTRYVARNRGEVPYEKYLPPHLCDVFPAASAVLVTIGTTTRYPCP